MASPIQPTRQRGEIQRGRTSYTGAITPQHSYVSRRPAPPRQTVDTDTIPRAYSDFVGIARNTENEARTATDYEQLMGRIATDTAAWQNDYNRAARQQRFTQRQQAEQLQGGLASARGGLATGAGRRRREHLAQAQAFAAAEAQAQQTATLENIARRAIDDVSEISDSEFQMLLNHFDAVNREIVTPTGRTQAWLQGS